MFLAGALLIGFAGMFVSCKDYDDDIDALGERVDNLQSTVNDLQTQIANGAILQSVTPSANGITVVTNKGTYEITNGKDGAKGDKGDTGATGAKGDKGDTGAAGDKGDKGDPGTPGTVITINDDGYWVIDGKVTEFNAKGQKGDKGDTGATGATGAAGKDADQVYYYPGADGFWYKVTLAAGATKADSVKTDISCFPAGTLTAVWNEKDGTLAIYNAAGTDKPVVINTTSELKSLVFVPQIYVDGVEGMEYSTFSYNKLSVKKGTQDTEKEEWSKAKTESLVSPTVTADYHINPANAVIDDTFTYTFETKANTPFVGTRANASKNFKVTPSFSGVKDGILTVNVDVTGTPASGEKISVIALKASKGGKDVVSDYATLYKNDIPDVVIAEPNDVAKAHYLNTKKLTDVHYRTNMNADKGSVGSVVWTTNNTSLNDSHKTCDTSVVYNNSKGLDLNTIVAVHQVAKEQGAKDAELTEDQIKALGLEFEFELVKNYTIGTPKTDQANFVDGTKIPEGIFIPKVYSTEGEASIGRTPIIRVLLKHGADIVKVAYIKVYISDKEADPARNYDYTLAPVDAKGNNVFAFACDNDEFTLTTTVKDMNVEIYNDRALSKYQFHDLYKNFVDGGEKGFLPKTVKNNVGTAKDVVNNETEGTHVISWTVTADDLWNAKADTLEHYCQYQSESGLYVTIRLRADVTAIKKKYPLTSTPNYYKQYWRNEPDKNIAYLNVAVPDDGSVDSTKCTFVNDLNGLFVNEKGLTVVDKNVTGLEFHFSSAVKNIKSIGVYKVKFSVSKDSLTLLLDEFDGKKVSPAAEIAYINNDGTAVPFNTVTYNRNSQRAKILLNTGEMYTYIGAKGYLCQNEERPVSITFNDKPYFQADFVRPIYVKQKAVGEFTDAVDFGQKGSYIKLEDLIDAYDWRDRSFADYPNYWDYYGVQSVTVDTETAKCTLNDVEQAVPATIILKQTDNKTTFKVKDSEGKETTVSSKYGFLTYRNNGAHVKDFNFIVTVSVKYYWGTVVTEKIEVKVNETIAK